MSIGLAALVLIGLGAPLAIAASGLWSSYQRDKADNKVAPPPAMMLADPVKPVDQASLRAAAAANPRDSSIRTKLGDAQMTSRDFDQAIGSYKEAVAADQNDATAWSALGEAYVQTIPSTRTQLPAEARAAFVRAIGINGNDLRARFYLAMEKDFLGRHDEAMDDWITMLAMVPTGSRADDAIRAAITASMGRSATILRRRVSDAMKLQPKPGAAPAPTSTPTPAPAAKAG